MGASETKDLGEYFWRGGKRIELERESEYFTALATSEDDLERIRALPGVDQVKRVQNRIFKVHVTLVRCGLGSEAGTLPLYQDPENVPALMDLLQKDERVFGDPAPQVMVKELADSSVNMNLRCWTNAADYWNLLFDLTKASKLRLEAEGLTIPFPQRDVHLFQETG